MEAAFLIFAPAALRNGTLNINAALEYAIGAATQRFTTFDSHDLTEHLVAKAWPHRKKGSLYRTDFVLSQS